MVLEQFQQPDLQNILRLLQGIIKRHKGMRRHAQRFSIPAETKIGRYRIFDQIADILNIQCCQKSGFIIHPDVSK